MNTEPRNIIIGLDLESTGLDMREHRILEIGMIHYNEDLEEMGRFQRVIATHPDLVRELCDDFVWKMHTDNGLLADLKWGAGRPLSDVEGVAVKWLRDIRDVELSRMAEAGVDKPRVNLVAAGSSVHFDMFALKHWMPTLAKQFSYRYLDASALLLCHRLVEKGDAAHRALDDVRQSMSIIRTYRDALKAVGA